MQSATETPPIDKGVASIRRNALTLVFLTIFLDLVGFGMFIPILANLARTYGASNAEAAALSTIFSLGTLIAVVVFGRLSDHYGRKKILAFTIALSAVTQFVTGFAGTYLFLVIARFIAGVASGNISVAQATVADLTLPRERGRSMIVIGLAFGGGFAAGPALGAGLTRLFPDSYLMAIATCAAILNLINLALVVWRLPETHHRMASPRIASLVAEVKAHEQQDLHSIPGANTRNSVWTDFKRLMASPPFRVVVLLQAMQVCAFVGVETILPVVLRDAYLLSDQRIYDVFILIGVTVLLVNGGVSRVVLRRAGEVRTLNLGQLSLALGIGLIPFVAPSVGLLLVSLVILATGTSLANPALSSLVSRLAPYEMQGFAFGTSQSVAAAARIVGPVTMGYLYDAQGGASSLYFSAGLLAVGFVLGLFGLYEVQSRFKLEQGMHAR